MPAINFINRLLQQNPEVCHNLSGFNGLIVGIQTAGLYLVGRITQQGLLESTTRRANTILILNSRALPELLQGQLPSPDDFALEGDAELGINLMLHLMQLRYHPQQDLHILLGSDLSTKAAKLGQVLYHISRLLMPHPTPEHSTVNDDIKRCTTEITQLKNELARTHKRLEQLEARLNTPRQHIRR